MLDFNIAIPKWKQKPAEPFSLRFGEIICKKKGEKLVNINVGLIIQNNRCSTHQIFSKKKKKTNYYRFIKTFE